MKFAVVAHGPGYISPRGNKIPGPSQWMGTVELSPHSRGGVVEAALSAIGVYAPRGNDVLRWTSTGRSATIKDGEGHIIVTLMPKRY